LRLPGLDRAALESIPAVELVAAVGAVQARLRAGEIALSLLRWSTGTSSGSPEVAVGAGDAAGVELMIGTTRDEMSMFALGSRVHHMITKGSSGGSPCCARSRRRSRIDCYRSARKGRGESTGNRDSGWRWYDVVFVGRRSVGCGTRSISRGPSCTSSPMRRRHSGNPRVVATRSRSLCFRLGAASAVAMFSEGDQRQIPLRRMQDC